MRAERPAFRARAARLARGLGLSVLSALPAAALAQSSGTAGPGLPLLIGQAAGGTAYSVPVQTLLFFTALSFLPAVVLMMTGFTRIVIVLSLLRQALGTQAAPPNQVIVGLSLFLTFFVMSPTLDKVYTEAWAPYAAQQIEFPEAAQRAAQPMRAFMLKQVRASDLKLFAGLAKVAPDTKAGTSTRSGTSAPFTSAGSLASLANSWTSLWRVCFSMNSRTGPSPRSSAAVKLISFFENGS